MLGHLEPPLRVVTPYGPALAILVINNGLGNHLEWVCFYKGGKWERQCWTWPNPLVRIDHSVTDAIPSKPPTSLFKDSRFMLTDEQWAFIEQCEQKRGEVVG